MLFDFMNGGFSYDPATFINGATLHQYAILFFGGLTFIGGFTQQIGAIWIGFKQKSYGIPVICTTWFFAHDTTFFINHYHWFHETSYVNMQQSWYSMGFYMITELFVAYQTLWYGRKEAFPGMTFFQALFSFIGLQVFAFAAFWWFMSMIDDPLYMFKFATTIIMSPLFNIPMMRARGSRRGFSLLSLSGITLLPFGFWPWLFFSEPYFLQPMIIVVAISNMLMALAGIWYWLKLPLYQPVVATS